MKNSIRLLSIAFTAFSLASCTSESEKKAAKLVAEKEVKAEHAAAKKTFNSYGLRVNKITPMKGINSYNLYEVQDTVTSTQGPIFMAQYHKMLGLNLLENKNNQQLQKFLTKRVSP